MTNTKNRVFKTWVVTGSRVLKTQDVSFQHYFETWQLTKMFEI